MRALALVSLAGCALVIAFACGRRDETLLCGEGRLGQINAAQRVDLPGGQPVLEARVAALASGWLVVWSAGTDGESDLWARAFDSNGVPEGSQAPITLIAGRSDRPRLSAGPGGLAIAWRDDRNGRNDAWATVIGSAGLPAFPTLFQSGIFAADQDPQPALAFVGTAWAVVWNGRGPDGNDHLYVQAMGADGEAVGPVLPIDASQLDRAEPPSAAAVGGALAVVDAESRPGASTPPDVFAYVLAPTYSPPFQTLGIAGGAAGAEIAGLGSLGGVLWCDDAALRFAALDSAGIAVAEHRVGPGCSPSITGADTAFLATWVDASGIGWVQALTPSGSAEGRAIRLGEATGRADVTWAGGRAAAVWAGSSGAWIQPLGCTGNPGG